MIINRQHSNGAALAGHLFTLKNRYFYFSALVNFFILVGFMELNY